MRKLSLFFGILVSLNACSIYTLADIKVLDYNGNLIREYNDAIVKEFNPAYQWEARSAFGLSFRDADGNPVHIRGGIIIVDNFGDTMDQIRHYSKAERTDIDSKVKKYNLLKLNIENNTEEIAKSSDSRFIDMKEEQTLRMEAEMTDIRDYLMRNYQKKID